jgi:hypothetical protein
MTSVTPQSSQQCAYEHLSYLTDVIFLLDKIKIQRNKNPDKNKNIDLFIFQNGRIKHNINNNK